MTNPNLLDSIKHRALQLWMWTAENLVSTARMPAHPTLHQSPTIKGDSEQFQHFKQISWVSQFMEANRDWRPAI